MIKEILDKLLPNQLAQLMYAFEHDLRQYIELPDKKFIGVNIESGKHLKIKESVGHWSYGSIKGDVINDD